MTLVYCPASGEGQPEHFPVWKKKGHDCDKNRRKILNTAVPDANREAISKQIASFIYLEELKTCMVCAIPDLVFKRIFLF